jgi:hypothetical protein
VDSATDAIARFEYLHRHPHLGECTCCSGTGHSGTDDYDAFRLYFVKELLRSSDARLIRAMSSRGKARAGVLAGENHAISNQGFTQDLAGIGGTASAQG